MTPPIYIAGQRHAGKDTLADAICALYPAVRKVKLTDPVYALARSWGMHGKERATLQRAGDYLRETYGADILAAHLILRTFDGVSVCADVRLPREGELLRAQGWLGIRIQRPDAARLASLAAVGEVLDGAEAHHQTETHVNEVPVDIVIDNDGTVADLAGKIAVALREIGYETEERRRGDGAVSDIADLSRKVAEIVGDDGFEIGSCPQGHDAMQYRPYYPHRPYYPRKTPTLVNGSVCPVCLERAVDSRLRSQPHLIKGNDYRDEARESAWLVAAWSLEDMWRARSVAIPTWHPEWRIGRGEPKPYAESLDLLVPVVEAWCKRHRPGRAMWELQALSGTEALNFGAYKGSVLTNGTIAGESYGDTAAESLTSAFLAAVSRWGA